MRFVVLLMINLLEQFGRVGVQVRGVPCRMVKIKKLDYFLQNLVRLIIIIGPRPIVTSQPFVEIAKKMS